MSADTRLASSFRSPSGFLFVRSGLPYRKSNAGSKSDNDLSVSSGLLEALTANGVLISHAEAVIEPADSALCYKVIVPAPVRFIPCQDKLRFSSSRTLHS